MNKIIKKLLSVLACFSLILPMATLTGCGERVFRISNCEDYIAVDEETGKNLAEQFEKYYEEKTGEKIKVDYTTFGTLEDLYNNMKMGDEYDLICPSDYMIEKMAREDMLQPLNLESDGVYNTSVSPYIKSVLEGVTWGEGESLSKYAAGYMWGTLGLVYNDATVTNKEDMKSWTSLWDSKYEGKFTIKDSVRDTYFIGLAKHYAQDLLSASETFNSSNKDAVAVNSYQTLLSSKFNSTLDADIDAVKGLLLTLKQKSKGMEVDSGKNDIVNGNIDVYFAWSGDAVYAISEASEDNVTLKYEVPKEGSNVWFDGWCIPKDSQNSDIAKEFIEYISSSENVIKNMDYTGYTSCISGQEVFNYVKDCYEVSGGGLYHDLSYFFGNGEFSIETDSLDGQFITQYPTKDIINRCVVMHYFEDASNEKIMTMWAEIKTN